MVLAKLVLVLGFLGAVISSNENGNKTHHEYGTVCKGPECTTKAVVIRGLGRKWTVAQDYCNKFYRGLYVMHSTEEAGNFIAYLESNKQFHNHNIWVGGKKDGSTMKWLDGRVVDSTYQWADRQPDGSGAYLRMWGKSHNYHRFDDDNGKGLFDFACNA